ARAEPVTPPPLTTLEVYQAFEAMADATGKGSRTRKADLIRGLLERASPAEAKYVVKNVFGEMRHGVSEGIMLDAVARAADAPPKTVRRAHQLWGDIAEVAGVALTGGVPALQAATVRLFRPLQPMLAQTADDMADVFAKIEDVALEFKFDGARVQVHAQSGGDEVRVYSRQLADVTASVPDLVAAVREGLRAQDAILEGEAVATGVEGRPLPFQDLMRRFRRVHDVDRLARQIPLHLHAFDLLWLDGQSLLDQPYEARRAALAGVIAPPLTLATQVMPTDVTKAEAFAQAAYEAGHEGVMAKRLSSAYTPGARGRHWLKLKHVETLDLVIAAADWGYGRRHGWLSNYHLAARDEDTGEYMVVGKTFKGPTDAEFQALTARLLALERHRAGSTVYVEPRLVVEVLFDEVQNSPSYPAGVALRLARIARVRDDKSPAGANTLQDVHAVRDRRRARKGHR
ncbi:MAG: ATP-dependent DNA ligase, partial [Chloroflexi bacterium]|nr:ATP-dependent DNA ligase [Chloroflexota bacterium]